MNKLSTNLTTLSLLPILCLIPLFYELIKNFHLGGIDLFNEFIFTTFNPRLDQEILVNTLGRLLETIIIALESWSISIFFGLILGLLSSEIFFKIFDLPIIIQYLIKLILTLIRSIHEIVWCLILMQIYGINFSIGILAICIPYTAINAKVIREQLETISSKKIDALIQLNGNKISIFLTIVWVPTLNIVTNFGFYRLECILRSTAILGIFGIGGIGTNIYLAFQDLNFRDLWTYIWSLGLLILFFNLIVKKYSFNKLNTKLTTFFLFVFSLLTIYSIYSILTIFFDENLARFDLIANNFNKFNPGLISFNLFKLISDTIYLSLLATAITISLPPFLFLIFNYKFCQLIIRVIAFWLRLIPTPITVLILLIFNEPSISLAALALGLYNSSITIKLLASNLKNTPIDNYIAMSSLGSSKRVSWLYGLYSKQIKSYFNYCLYRSDILIRETAIVGIIGSVGLGWQLQESLTSFAWEEVTLVICSFSAIAIIVELINDRIKANLS